MNYIPRLLLPVLFVLVSAFACSDNANNQDLTDVVSDTRDNVDATSEDTTPDDATSEDTTPDDATSEDTTPDDATSEDTTPDDATSEDTTPDDTTSEDTTPGDATSEDTTPDDTTPDDAEDDTSDIDEFDGLYDDALRAALRATHTGHRGLGYSGSDNARDFMFEYAMANDGPPGEIECIYTGRKAIVDGRGDAQNQSPMWNTEHTWPQSRGAGSEPMKSDIHHLFVSDALINSKRSNYFFGNVVSVTYQEGGSKLGTNAAGETRFEVRPQTRGNIARAVFYFAVAYDKSINADEEAVLRQWHVEDPVDDAERARNDAVAGVQNSRNFFIDHPELVERISDF